MNDLQILSLILTQGLCSRLNRFRGSENQIKKIVRDQTYSYLVKIYYKESGRFCELELVNNLVDELEYFFNRVNVQTEQQIVREMEIEIRESSHRLYVMSLSPNKESLLNACMSFRGVNPPELADTIDWYGTNKTY